MTITVPDTAEELTRTPGMVTPQQYDYLRQGIDPSRVRQMQGQSHVEAWDVRRTLIRVFGFGGFDVEDRGVHLITQIDTPPTSPGGKTRYTVVYRADVRLVIKDPNGRVIAYYDDSATGDAINMPSVGDAHDFALKTASSQALKRCAVNLGDQFGLSLYNKGATGGVVVGSLVSPALHEVAPTPEDAPPVLGGEMDEEQHHEEAPAPPAQRTPAPTPTPDAAQAVVAAEVAKLAVVCADADKIRGTWKEANAKGLLACDVSAVVTQDQAGVVGIAPADVLPLGDWLKAVGAWVKANGGLSVADQIALIDTPDSKADPEKVA